MAVATARDFLSLLERSKLLPPDALRDARRQVGPEASGDSQGLAAQLVARGAITAWQAERLLAGQTGFFLGKYKLLERIGRGGMGAVFKAQHAVMGRTVALKVMNKSLVGNPDAVARFLREVKSAAALNHPNIVTAFDADCVDDVHFLVMEYVAGHDLQHFIRQGGPLDAAWCCECIRQAALGLQHAHERGLVHRDIKPSNLLVSEGGAGVQVKLLDLGLARFATEHQDDGGLTKAGQILGTPDYIAPEQAQDIRWADTRSDIYSLGCTLFALLTGRRAFEGPTIAARLLARTQFDAPALRQYRPEAPRRLERVLAKMLARNPADRYQTPGEVAAALEPLTHSAESTADSSSVCAAPSPGLLEESSPAVDDRLLDFLNHLGTGPAGDTPGHGAATLGDRGRSAAYDSTSATFRRPWHRQPAPLVAVLCAAMFGAVGLALWWAANNSRGTDGEANTAEAQAYLIDPNRDGTASDSDPPAAAPSAGPHFVEVGPNADEADVAAEGLTASDFPTVVVDQPVAGETPADPTAAKPREPRTLVVGNVPHTLSFHDALSQAGPGDTILIRTSGVVNLTVADLTGKSPLTIAGDSEGRLNFWPVLRQVTEEVAGKAPPLFHADDELRLTLRRIHLVVGETGSPDISAIFGLPAGAIVLDECTVTAAVRGAFDEDRGAPLPLVRLSGGAEAGPVDITLERSFFRGLRLTGLVQATHPGDLKVRAVQSSWAGGAAPWLTLHEPEGQVSVTLENCTLHNLAGLLAWQDAAPADEQGGVRLEINRSLLVGRYPGDSPLVDLSSPTDAELPAVAAEGRFSLAGGGNAYHRFAGFYHEGRRQQSANVAKWQRLREDASADADRLADPCFRVWPDGAELEFARPRDLQPRVLPNRPRAERVEADCGADFALLPAPPLALAYTYASDYNAVGTSPSPLPRTLVVHQHDGPYRTLEEAFAEWADGDTIEIADDAVYVPRRDFNEPAAEMPVLVASRGSLRLRARDGCRPVVVLDEAALTAPGTGPLKLIFLEGCREGEIEGLEFRYRVGERPCQLIKHTGGLLRVVGCTFVDTNPQRVAVVHENTAGTSNEAYFQWCENNVSLGRSLHVWLHDRARQSVYRNCLFEGAMTESWRGGNDAARFRIERCSVLGGELLRLGIDNVPMLVECRDSLVVSKGSVVQFFESKHLDLLRWRGMNNVLCSSGPFCASTSGRPLLAGIDDWRQHWGDGASQNEDARPPEFKRPSMRDPFQQYRLDVGQPAARMAADGGPAGVRVEYLPELLGPPRE